MKVLTMVMVAMVINFIALVLNIYVHNVGNALFVIANMAVLLVVLKYRTKD